MTLTLELTVDGANEEGLKSGARDIISHVRPNWKQNKLKYKVYTSGITNQLLGVWTDNKDSQLLIRIYGHMTDMFIDREAEKNNFKILRKAGCGPELYAMFKNGLCYGYTIGEPVATDQVTHGPLWKCVSKEMAKFHRIEVADKEHPLLFPKMHKLLSLMPDKFTDLEKEKRLKKSGYSKEKLQKEAEVLTKELEGLGCPVVFSHNDILLSNIIWNEAQSSATFIDYEYGGPNFQPFDISNHFNEFAGVDEVDYNRYPSKAFQYEWLRSYLACYQDRGQTEVTEMELEKWYVWVNKFALSSHLFWGAWAMVQAQYSTKDFHYLDYGIIRLNEYFTRKEEFLSLKTPS